MATIKKQGKGYKITVSNGYDLNGKQLREHTTWVPEPGMTAKQIEKELKRQSVLFEEQVRNSVTQNNKIRFKDFSDLFIKDYAELYLKPKTQHSYKESLVRINEAIGHIKLCDLRTTHINSFYRNLQEEGIRRGAKVAVCTIDLATWMKEQHLSCAALAIKAGVSEWAVKSAKAGRRIEEKSATAIAAVIGASVPKAFRIEQNSRPLKSSSILVYHRTLSAVLSRAVKWGYLTSNPTANAERPSLGAHESAYLDEDDARRLLVLLQDEPIRWRALFTFDLLSGLRRGELLGLRWEDIDFDTGTLCIRQTSNYLPGNGMYVGTPKTTSSARPLRLSRTAVLLLLEYQRWQDAQRKLMGEAWEDKDGRIFTTESGAPVFPDSVTQWFSKFVKRTDLPPVHVHSLRHTYASLMIADGVPLVVVSHQLGHAQTSTTANIYAHVIASAEAKAMETFDRFGDIVAPHEEQPKPVPESKDLDKNQGIAG